MGAWDAFKESFKAAFLGNAGVDYYAKRTQEEVRGLRNDLRSTPASPWADAKRVQSAFAEIHAAILELQAALTDRSSDDMRWSGLGEHSLDALCHA